MFKLNTNEIPEKVKITEGAFAKFSIYASMAGEYEIYGFPLHTNKYGGDELTINEIEIPPQEAEKAKVVVDTGKARDFLSDLEDKHDRYRVMGMIHSHANVGGKRHSFTDTTNFESLFNLVSPHNRIENSRRKGRANEGGLEVVVEKDGEEIDSFSFNEVRDIVRRYFALENELDSNPVELPPLKNTDGGLASRLKKTMDDKGYSNKRKARVFSKLIHRAKKYKSAYEIAKRDEIQNEKHQDFIDEKIRRIKTKAFEIEKDIYSFAYSIVVDKDSISTWADNSIAAVAYIQACKDRGSEGKEFLYQEGKEKRVDLEILTNVDNDVKSDLSELKKKYRKRVKKVGFSGKDGTHTESNTLRSSKKGGQKKGGISF